MGFHGLHPALEHGFQGFLHLCEVVKTKVPFPPRIAERVWGGGDSLCECSLDCQLVLSSLLHLEYKKGLFSRSK